MDDNPPPISPAVTGSWAYYTLKDRLPVILTKVIDYFCREKKALTGDDKEVSADLKEVLARWSRLKNQIQTDKPLLPLQELDYRLEHDDIEYWNALLASAPHSWFSSDYLLVECYFFRLLHHSLEMSKHFRLHDHFLSAKTDSLLQLEGAIAVLACCTEELLRRPDEAFLECEEDLQIFLQLCVWGNQVDLCLASGDEVTSEQIGGPMQRVKSNRKNLLVDHSKEATNVLLDIARAGGRVDLIADNAGYELLTDLCLCLLLLRLGVRVVNVHIKARPWFVSDTTKDDVEALKGMMGKHAPSLIPLLDSHLLAGRLSFPTHKFWTLAAPHQQMAALCPDLFASLRQSELLIFKGDLNYRKLVGDLSWDFSTLLETALGPLLAPLPPLLALRTVKGGPVVGVSSDKVAEAKERHGEAWNTQGVSGVVQLSMKR